MSRAEEVWGEFLPAGEYYQVLDPEGQVLMETGRFVYLQDQYLAADNKLYEIIDIDEDRRVARTKFVEDEKLEVFPWHDLRKELGLTVIEASDEGGKGMIAIYHTHNAESYVPTDGADSINGKGGIHQVGSAFADALETRRQRRLLGALHLPLIGSTGGLGDCAGTSFGWSDAIFDVLGCPQSATPSGSRTNG